MCNKELYIPVFSKMEINKCCGCEVCCSVCPVNAITMKPDEEGFLYPELDVTKCIKCNKCTTVCPMLNVESDEEISEKYFAASNKSIDILIKSASGGIFSFIYNQFIRQYPDGYVVGAIYSEDCKSILHICSNKKSDFEKMRGSKYFQSLKGNVYKETKEILNVGGAILFTGAPCEVAALKTFLGREYSKLWTIDYICKGSSTPKMLKEYVGYLEKKYKSNILCLNMRYKWKELDNWIPQFLNCTFKNGKSMTKEFYNTELGICFQIVQRKNCAECPYREKRHSADFTIGDYHGVSKTDNVYNKLGTSVMVTNNEFAYKLWNGFDKSSIVYAPIEKEDIYNKNRNLVDYRRSELAANLEKYNAVIAVRKSIGIKEKIKMNMPVRLLRKITTWRRKLRE